MKLRKEETKESSKERKEEKNPPPPPARAKNSVFHQAGRRMGLTDLDVDEWLDYQKQTGWMYPSGRSINANNFHRSLRMWGKINEEIKLKRGNGVSRADRAAFIFQKREQAEVRKAEAAQKRRDKIAASKEGWVLCAEECAHCDGLGCSRGIKIPPAHQSWPKPPRECPAFKAKEVS